jgi:hypothetical protein
MYGEVFAHGFTLHPLTSTNNDQLATATDLPASGSYVDVGGYEYVTIILRFGTIHASDAPVVAPKCADSVSGTLDALDTAGTLQHTAAADDDGEYVTWHIEVASLPTDHHFLALDVVSGASNGSYANAEMFGRANSLPVTQATTVLPGASQYYMGGGQLVAES